MNATLPPASLIEMKRPAPRRRRRFAGVWALVVVLAVAAVLVGVRYVVPRPAETFAVAPSTLIVEAGGPGTLDATNMVAVGSRVQGRLATVEADINDRVEAGAVLATLESDDLTSQLAVAEASADAARQAVDIAKSERDRASAVYADASATLERQKALVGKGIVSQQDLSKALAAFDQAGADLARAEQAIAQAAAQARSAAANVDVVRAELDETIIRAPFSGIVVARSRNPGDIVTAGASILELVDPDSIVLTARFDESAMAAMKPGLPVSVSFTSAPDATMAGHVTRLGRIVDTETREFTVDIRLDTLPENWAIGQRGLATISLDRLTDVLTVPQRFVEWRDGKPGVWVVRDGRARWQQVTLGPEGGDRVAVIAGLAEGDVALVADRVFAFMKVRSRPS